jgi:putative FmdB family regulatory protein
MLILYDFRCPHCGNEEEALVQRDSKEIRCGQCTNPSDRVITPIRFSLEGHSGHFPTAASKWERQHEKAGRMPSETDPDGW